MADDTPTTPSDEPGINPPTSAGGPVADSDSGSTSPPEPTVEDLHRENERLKANVAGRSREADEERRRRMELEQQLAAMSRQPPPMSHLAPPPEPTYEQLAAQLNEAAINGDNAATARILTEVHRRAQANTETSVLTKIADAAAQGQQVQSYGQYLAATGMKPGSILQQKTAEIEREIHTDLRTYGAGSQYFFTSGNPAWIRSIAAERAKAVLGADRNQASSDLRNASAQTAATESGSAGSGNPPGKAPASTGAIYLSDAEKHAAHRMYDNLSKAEAEKRYWNNIAPGMRDLRIQNKKAVI